MKTRTTSGIRRTPTALGLAISVWFLGSLGLVSASIVGQWDFDAGLNASIGVNMEYFDGPGGATEANTQFGTTTSFGISNVSGQAANVMRVPKNTSAMGYAMNPNAVGNGGGGLLNQYSLAFDVYFPSASSGKSRCLIQIDEPWANSNEGEFYLAANNGLGTLTKPQGTVTPDVWHRLVITVDLTAIPPRATKYIDGAMSGQETLADSLDGRWALGTSRALLFTDNTGAFEVAYVNSIQVHDTVLSPGYVAALGVPSGDALPTSAVPVAVVDGIRPAPNDGFVLPGTLIEADLVAAGQPIPTNSLEMQLDGVPVSPAIAYPAAGVLRLSCNPGLLAPESQHTVRVAFVDPVIGTNVQQAQWSFRMCPYQLPPPDPTSEGLLYLGFENPSAVDGSVVTDGSPAHNQGTLHLLAGVDDLRVAGAVNNALDFSINQTAPQNYADLTYGYGDVPNSFSAWVKVDSNYPSATRVGVLLGNYPVANAINWEIHTSGRPRVYWGYNSGSLVDWIVNDDVRSGQWEHLAFVRDPAKGFAYYRNGLLVATQSNAGPSVLPVEPPYVGTDRRTSGFQPFRGVLDEVSVFARSLSSNEVFRLYTAHMNFPKFLYATPPITRLTPLDGATGVAGTTRVVAFVDESFSSNTVNLASVQLSINGTMVTSQAVRSNQAVRISGAPTLPLSPLSTTQVRVRFLDNATPPHETIQLWTFVTGPAPVIVWMSAGSTVAAGEEVTLGAQVSGIQPITYQWRLDGIALPGKTNSVLSLPAITTAQAGSYDLLVSNPGGSATSSTVSLRVLPSLPLGGLLDSVTAYYPFESQVSGVVSNAARAAGYPGFPQDEAWLNGAEGDPSAVVPPFTTNLAKVRSGTGALDTDGAGDYGKIAGNPVAVGEDWSVAAWFKPDTGGVGYLGSTRAFVFETSGGIYPISFGLRAGTSGNSNFQLYSDYATGTDPSRDYQVANTNVDRWHHIVVVYRSAGAALEGYLDGTLTHQIALTGNLNPGYVGFNLGTYRNADSRWFKGQIDEVAVWQRSLSSADVTNLFAVGQQGQSLAARINQPDGESLRANLTAYYDFDTQANWEIANRAAAVGGTGSFQDDSITLKGGAIDPSARIYPITHNATLARVGHGALSGDGTNDYAHLIGNPVDPNQNWSVAAWFKPDTSGLGLSGTTRYSVFETAGANFPISFGLGADLDPGFTDFSLYTLTATGSGASATNLVPNSSVDQWHQIVLTYDAAGGVLKGYVDGSETQSVVLGPGATLSGYTGFNLGTYRAADGRWFKGLIDEVAFWQRKLSPTAVSQAYALGNAGVSWLTSVPRISAFAPHPSPTSSFALTWQASAGLNYDVQASSNLVDWSYTVVSNLTADTGTVSIVISPTQPVPVNGYYDPGLSGAATRFYRVRWNQ
jgi:hypothetical protein